MKWFYAYEGQSLGPVDDSELAHLAGAGRIDGSTLVWNEGLPDWRPYAQVGPILAAAPPALGVSNAAPQRFQPAVGAAMRYAGFWVRVGAALLDFLIVIPVLALVFLAFYLAVPDFLSAFFPGRAAQGNGALLPFRLITMAIGISYETFFVGKWGATPGKMICKLRVVRPDGDRVSYLRAFARYFGRLLSAIPLDLGYLIVAFDSEKRGLHDYICSTRVIHTRPNAEAEELVSFRY